MVMSVNTNTGAQVALQNLNATNASLATVQNRINTGKSVASAKDNGAIWAIAQGQRADIGALSAVKQSLDRGIAAVDVALAAGETVSDLLLQLKEKALAATDASLKTSARAALNEDFKALRDQIATVTGNAEFNGVNLLKTGTTGFQARANVPGTYSLRARSREEQIAVDSLLGRNLPSPAAVVVVVDAAALGRALFMAVEVIATGVPVVIAVNMSDEAARDGMVIDLAKLAVMTGAEVVRTVATRGEGIAELRAAIGRAAARVPADARILERPAALAPDIAELEAAILAEGVLERPGAARAWATWLLLSLDDDGADDLAGIPPSLRTLTLDIRHRAADAGRNVDLEIISSSYQRVDAIVEAVVRRSPEPSRRRTDRIDAILTHGLYGGAVFAVVMLVVFQTLFTWSEPAIALIESARRPRRHTDTAVHPNPGRVLARPAPRPAHPEEEGEGTR